MSAPTEKHRDTARKLYDVARGNDEPRMPLEIIAAALANERIEGIRRAAEIAQRTAKYHLDASDMNLPVEPSPIIAKDRARVAFGISAAILSEIGDQP